MKNISKRDIKVFLLGVLFMFLIVIIYEWEEFKSGFSDGFNGKPFKEQEK